MHKEEKRLTQDALAILEGMEHAGADGARVGVPRRSQGVRNRCSRGLTGGETGQGRAGLGSAPNKGLELTASSVRSCLAPASGSSSGLALACGEEITRTTWLAAAGFGMVMLLSQGFAAQAAEIKLIAEGPLTAVFKELGPLFERETGHTLATRFAATPVVKREIDAGETFDIAISTTSAIDEWSNAGKIVASTRVAMAYAGLGVGIRAGASKPDISSVEASKRALLNATSVAHGAESASAAYFKSLLKRLGIAEEMQPKLKPMGPGAAYESVARGEADIVVAVVPGIVAAPGVELVGPFPSELQTYVSFAAGVSTGAKEPEAAQALITFLASPAAVAVIKAKGMEPGTP